MLFSFTSFHISNLSCILHSLSGRPGPGLTTCGVSQISDSEDESENDKDNGNHKDNDKYPDHENSSIKKAEKRERDRKKNKGEKSKEDERGETDIGISKHINSAPDTSNVKKRKSKGGSSSEVEVVVYDIRSDNEVDTDVVQVFPTQQSAANNRSSKRKTSVEDLFYHTKEADRWDSQTPGIEAQPADHTTSKKKKKIDGVGSTKRKRTSHPAKNVPSNSDSDSSEDDYDGVVLRR